MIVQYELPDPVGLPESLLHEFRFRRSVGGFQTKGLEKSPIRFEVDEAGVLHQVAQDRREVTPHTGRLPLHLLLPASDARPPEGEQTEGYLIVVVLDFEDGRVTRVVSAEAQPARYSTG